MKTFVSVQNIPSPYRLHLTGELWRQLKERGVELQVHFMSDMSKGHENRPMSWRNPKIDFPHRYWSDHGLGFHHFNPGLIARLVCCRPDWLLVGCPFDTFTGIALSLLARVDVKCCWVEGNTKAPGALAGAKGCLKRLVLSHYRFVAVPGSDGGKYITLHQNLTKLRMPEPVMLPNLIDETRFCPVTDDERWRLKQDCFGIVGERVCLIPARLDPVKGLVQLFLSLPVDLLNRWRIVLMGQGEQRAELMTIAANRGFAERVQILDYVAYDDMPKHYAAADLMLLPSVYDPNPLTVVEALHSGLPVALSDQLGNVEEGVTDGRNGWVLPVKDGPRFAEALRHVFSASEEELREKGRRSKEENAQFWNTKQAISDFLDKVGVGWDRGEVA